jgi:hypothetical protein
VNAATHAVAPARRRISDLPWPVWFFIASMVVPAEFHFEVEGIRIGPQRIVLLAAAAGTAHWLWSTRRLGLHDLLILAAALWAWGASFANLAPSAAIERGGSFALETAVAYLLPSACLGTLLHVRLAVRAFVPVVVILAGLGAIEAVAGHHFIANAAAGLMDQPEPFVADTRLGLLRARATFAHQILFGVFCASLFALFWFEARSPVERGLRAAACGAGVFFSLSSAAWILLALQALLIAAERATRNVAGRARLALALLLAAAAALELAVQGGIAGFITRYLALNSDTAYYRQLIWQHVTDDILANPLSGTGGSWTRLSWMVESIDQTYFAKAIRYGIPTIALMVAGALTTGLALARTPAPGGDGAFRALRAGWFLCILAIGAAGLTVDYFGRALPFVMFIIGLGAALARAARR